MTAKEQSVAGTRTVRTARQWRDELKLRLEELDASAAAAATDLRIEDKLLPRNAYIGAPGTYARHVYNVLRESGR